MILKTITCTSRPTNTGPRYDKQVFMIHGIKCIAQKLTSCNTAAVSLQLERKTERTREVKTVNQRERTGSAAYNKIRPIIFIRNIAPYQNCNNRTAASNILLVACMNFN